MGEEAWPLPKLCPRCDPMEGVGRWERGGGCLAHLSAALFIPSFSPRKILPPDLPSKLLCALLPSGEAGRLPKGPRSGDSSCGNSARVGIRFREQGQRGMGGGSWGRQGPGSRPALGNEYLRDGKAS